MRQLARTLLILGTVTACERADAEPRRAPLVDVAGRPAVGNIGQSGRETGRPAAVAVAVAAPARRETRAPIAAVPRRPAALQLSATAQSALLNKELRPAVGNVLDEEACCSKGRPMRREGLEERARRLAAEQQVYAAILDAARSVR